jgi:hypothetical protein
MEDNFTLSPPLPDTLPAPARGGCQEGVLTEGVEYNGTTTTAQRTLYGCTGKPDTECKVPLHFHVSIDSERTISKISIIVHS